MKHILFVDDDANLLSGLRRTMREMKDEWHMDFTDSGEKALQLMRSTSYDAIVSDMRMPGMNGAQLLRHVMEDYPNVIRIVLSGHAEKKLMLDCASTVHQYLAKPCDASQIRQTINRACELRSLLDSDDLQKLVSGLNTIPSLPELYLEIVEMMKSPDVSVKDVGETIARDIGMTVKIMQLVNSAFFGLKHRVNNPADAVALLGMEVLQALVLTTSVFSELEQFSEAPLDSARLWLDATETGALARQIAVFENMDSIAREYAFMAGMLHAVGQLVLAVNMPQEYADVIVLAKEKEIEIWQAEQEILGHSQMAVGGYLLGLWGIADPIVEAVAYYRFPMESHGPGFWPVTAVHAASGLLRSEKDATDPTRHLDMKFLKGAGVDSHVEQWQDLMLQMRNTGTEK